ncbi:hypothetical protein L2E82_20923 [Cichorium intybus]|uniref:Uncharacterized protein n=1 Tax=Cichorium intybus TaxID=13427 RepID=A0ACB9DUG2_CICIN|nr:hypothetical protein L2E82_20923 [Cichorium intybus]
MANMAEFELGEIDWDGQTSKRRDTFFFEMPTTSHEDLINKSKEDHVEKENTVLEQSSEDQNLHGDSPPMHVDEENPAKHSDNSNNDGNSELNEDSNEVPTQNETSQFTHFQNRDPTEGKRTSTRPAHFKDYLVDLPPSLDEAFVGLGV